MVSYLNVKNNMNIKHVIVNDPLSFLQFCLNG